MLDPAIRPLPFGHARRRRRLPLVLCAIAAAALTQVVAPRASSTANAPLPPGLAQYTPLPETRFVAADAPRVADLLIVGRDGFGPIETPPLLFPQAEGGVRTLITSSALTNNLPPDFLLRLLRQESGLNPNAISPVGAQGIAQFMPGTAAERGLRNPFDPVEAIPKSAELLREHQARFGNLGLAAAAYNAGPQRVRGWLDGRSGMPAETRDYVVRITGRTVEDWAMERGRAVSGPISFLIAPAYASVARPAPLAPGAGLFETARVPRATPMPAARTAKRGSSPRLAAPARQPHSEQALCAVLNGAGRTCLVQAVY